MLTRRKFVGITLGLIAAPAIVRASSLMPVRAWTDKEFPLWKFEEASAWLNEDMRLRLLEVISSEFQIPVRYLTGQIVDIEEDVWRSIPGVLRE